MTGVLIDNKPELAKKVDKAIDGVAAYNDRLWEVYEQCRDEAEKKRQEMDEEYRRYEEKERAYEQEMAQIKWWMFWKKRPEEPTGNPYGGFNAFRNFGDPALPFPERDDDLRKIKDMIEKHEGQVFMSCEDLALIERWAAQLDADTDEPGGVEW